MYFFGVEEGTHDGGIAQSLGGVGTRRRGGEALIDCGVRSPGGRKPSERGGRKKNHYKYHSEPMHNVT